MCLDPQQSVVYQLRLVLSGVSPMIWRRLLLSGNTHLAHLHNILQILFSWSDERSSRFRIHGKDYEIAEWGEIDFDCDRHSVRLSDLHLHCRERFLYEYDFTAGWRLEIRLEKILPLDPKRQYPVCIGGSGTGPPEHCAGVWAYLEQRDRDFSHPPIEDLSLLAVAVGRVLESGDRRLIGDLDELREVLQRVDAYRRRQTDHFDRRLVNRQLQIVAETEGGQP